MDREQNSKIYRQNFAVNFGAGIAFKLVSLIRTFSLKGSENRTLHLTLMKGD